VRWWVGGCGWRSSAALDEGLGEAVRGREVAPVAAVERRHLGREADRGRVVLDRIGAPVAEEERVREVRVRVRLFRVETERGRVLGDRLVDAPALEEEEPAARVGVRVAGPQAERLGLAREGVVG